MGLQVPFQEKRRAMSLSGTRPEPITESTKRRQSSISSPLGPWARRNSFLSRDMLLDENYSVYESHSVFTSNGYTKYNVISLRESQGFVFNQDLFASPYQQSRSLQTEKKYHHKSRSPSSVESSSVCTRRRHTSYNETRPTFLKGQTDAMDVDAEQQDSEQAHGQDNEHEHAMGSSSEDSDEYEDSANNSIYRVKVTDIILDEKDTMIYPT